MAIAISINSTVIFSFIPNIASIARHMHTQTFARQLKIIYRFNLDTLAVLSLLVCVFFRMPSLDVYGMPAVSISSSNNNNKKNHQYFLFRCLHKITAIVIRSFGRRQANAITPVWSLESIEHRIVCCILYIDTYKMLWPLSIPDNERPLNWVCLPNAIALFSPFCSALCVGAVTMWPNWSSYWQIV